MFMREGKHTDETMHKGLTYYVMNGQVVYGEYKGKKVLPFVLSNIEKEAKLSDLEIARNLELPDMKKVYWVEVELKTVLIQPSDIDTTNWKNKPERLPEIKEKK